MALVVAAMGVVIALTGAGVALSGRSADRQVAVVAGDNLPVNQDATSINAHNSPTIVVDPTDPTTLVVAGRIDRPRFSAGVHTSRDGGETWQDVTIAVPPGEDRPFAPDLAFDGDGTLYVLFTTLRGGGNNPGAVWLERSTDEGKTFSDPVRVTGPFAFQARLAVDQGSGAIYVTWLQATAEAVNALNALGNPPNPIVIASSNDGGATFGEPERVSDDERLRVGAATPVVGPDGMVYVLYEDFGDDVRDFGGLEGPVHDGRFQLVLARSADGAASFGPGRVVEAAVIPTERFLVYLPKFPSIAVDDRSRIFVTWASGGAGSDGSTVFLRRSEDAGQTWTDPARVDDDRGGDQYLPRVAVAPNGRVDVLFLHHGEEQESTLTTATLATSLDGGGTFSTVVASDAAFDSRVGPGSERGAADAGSRLGLASLDDAAFAVWTDTRRGTLETDKQDLYFAAVATEG